MINKKTCMVIILIALLFSLIAYTQASTVGSIFNNTTIVYNSTDNLKVNKSGDTMGNNAIFYSSSHNSYIAYENASYFGQWGECFRYGVRGYRLDICDNKTGDVQGITITNTNIVQQITASGIDTYQPINMHSKKITALADPTYLYDAVTKQYVDNSHDNLKVNKTGDAITGNISIGNDVLIRTDAGRSYDLEINSSSSSYHGMSVTTHGTNRIAFTLYGDVSSSTSLGKAFQLLNNTEGYARGVFYYDGSYGIGGGSAGRDLFIDRSSASNLRISSDRGSGNANLTITGMSGTGNAYACVDSNGKLYRSGVACV